MTPYVFQTGDFCYVYKINNQLSNSFICDKIIPTESSASTGATLTLGEERLAPQMQNMELTTNKTTAISGDSTDQQYPSARAVYVALSEVAAQEQGAYVVDATASDIFATDSSELVLTANFTDTNGTSIAPGSLKVGDSIFVVQDQYPNRWVYAVDTTNNIATLKSTRVDSGAGVVEDVTLNGSSVVHNNIAALTTGSGIVANGGELSLSISNYNSINPKTQSYSILDNLDIYLQSGTTGYRAAVSNLPYSRMVVQAPNSEDLSAVNNGDFIFARNS